MKLTEEQAIQTLAEFEKIKDYKGSDLDKADQYIEKLEAEIDRLTERAEKAEKRAEAAIRDLRLAVKGISSCNLCKNIATDECVFCTQHSEFKWKG